MNGGPSPDSASSALRAASATWPSEPEVAEAGLSSALETLERAGTSAPERARLRARLGQLRIFLGRLDAALRVLYDALELGDDGYVALQLGSALTWRGDAPALAEAEGRFARALAVARRHRDGALAIGALCGRGELRLAGGRPQEAVEAFGEALGISEFSGAEGPSILPLTGLARGHAAWWAPAKAAPLAQRALERAHRAKDLPGQARALAALAAAESQPEAELLDQAVAAADAAPHRPLALRLRVERWSLAPSEEVRERLLEQAQTMGLAGDAQRLRARPEEPGGAASS